MDNHVDEGITLSNQSSLVGQYLIAMPTLDDPNFERAVLFLCAHSDEGALGLVVNQPHAASMDDVIEQLGLEWNQPKKPVVFQGGPVSPERGFILYEESVDISGYIRITPSLYLGTSPDLLQHFSRADDPGRFFFALGYAGWSTGQLENELRDNAWLVGSFDHKLLFEVPVAERWAHAIRQLGIDPAMLVGATGTVN